uniref:Uncharacterized protein n=1 Tax=Arundo donax TaxID=35708 RepID=A0A0A9C417_ARUDO
MSTCSCGTRTSRSTPSTLSGTSPSSRRKASRCRSRRSTAAPRSTTPSRCGR